jgi:hypothetical protein
MPNRGLCTSCCTAKHDRQLYDDELDGFLVLESLSRRSRRWWRRRRSSSRHPAHECVRLGPVRSVLLTGIYSEVRRALVYHPACSINDYRSLFIPGVLLLSNSLAITVCAAHEAQRCVLRSNSCNLALTTVFRVFSP